MEWLLRYIAAILYSSLIFFNVNIASGSGKFLHPVQFGKQKITLAYKKQKKDYERDYRPDGDVFDALQNIIIHGFFWQFCCHWACYGHISIFQKVKLTLLVEMLR